MEPDSSSSTAAAEARSWVMLDRVAFVDDEEDPRDFSLTIAEPPRLSTLTVPAKFHANPRKQDRLPYLAAVDPFGLLVHTAASPSVGLNFDDNPSGSFAVVRGFLPGSNPDEATGNVERVPDRVGNGVPPISNIKNVGLVTLPGSGGNNYVIAELQIEYGAELANLILFRSETSTWAVRRLLRPDMPGRTNLYWEWKTDDVISFEGKIWWINLWRGLIRCNPFNDQPVLYFDQFPEHISLEHQYISPHEIEADRCVRVSKEKLRYVEITRVNNDPVESTMVVVWTLLSGPRGMAYWRTNCISVLGDIWETESYKATGLPKQVPILAGVHPSNPDLVYFFLEQHLFSVNLDEKMIVHFVNEQYQLIQALDRSRLPQPISWRQVQAWKLPPSLCTGLKELSVQYPSDSGNLRLKAAQLRRQEYVLKRREEVIQIREETVNGLHKSLLAREQTKDDSRWNKVQVVILGVLISGLTLLFPFLPWFPREFLTHIVISFSVVASCCCIALPCALFGSHRWQTSCGECVARIGFMLFSLFILYGLYQMAFHPTLDTTGHSSPPAPADPEVTRKFFWTYSSLAVIVTSGQIISWAVSCCCAGT
ncbi:hypothetical protein E2562_029824 [Oryza meyeriana var. granulata]|uniref:DUF1618 domain-containing protein n=1 Tax=Oryza meyeriana var. granulata TaxID=110450 RepID=A0A6G1CUK9_9ORYZ|nr:hypothetical protein E2562_029824 [Oryza meyeriana var. granulata]